MGLSRKLSWLPAMGLLFNLAYAVESTPTFNSTPEFDAALTKATGSMFTSCFNINPLLSATVNAFSGKPGAIGAGGVCTGSEAIPKEHALLASCTNYSKEAADLYAKELEESLGAFACKRTQLEGLKAELSCLTTQADSLGEQISSLQNAFTQNIQRMQKDVEALQAREADLKAQYEDTSAKLTGKGADGSGGLLGAQAKMKEAVASLPALVTDIQNKQTYIANLKINLENNVKRRKMFLAVECFNAPGASAYTCEKNGKNVSLKEYLLCRYEQNQFVGADGQLEMNETRRAKAAGNKASLESLLNQIFAEMPSNGSARVTSDPNSKDSSPGNQAMGVLTPADIEAKYGAQLAKFDGAGLPIHKFFIDKMTSCYNKTKARVDNERLAKDSDIGKDEEGIKQEERKVSTEVNTHLNNFNNLFSDSMAALTGTHIPLNIANCQGAKPDLQLGCLREIRANLEGTLSGNTPNSTVQMVVKGTNPQTYVNFKCQGLNGCVTAMQSLQRNVQAENVKVGQSKKDYVNKANASIMAYTKQIAQQLSVQSQALTNRLKSINMKMGDLGISHKVDIKNVQGEQLEGDQGHDGLYGLPKSMLNTLGGYMSPPMLDVHGNDFSSASQGIGETVKKMNEKEQKIQDYQSKLHVQMSKCPAELAKKKFEAVDKLAASTNQSCCQWKGQNNLPDAYQKNKIQELVRSFGEIDADFRGETTIDKTLTGFAMGPSCTRYDDTNALDKESCKNSVETLAKKFEAAVTDAQKASGSGGSSAGALK